MLATVLATAPAWAGDPPKNNIKGAVKGVKSDVKKGAETLDNKTVFGSQDSVDYRDEKQGKMGDCYLLSTLADDAYQDPTDIPKNHFVHDAQGNLTIFKDAAGRDQVGVIFKVLNRSGGGARDEVVKVDARLPLKDGKPVFAQAGKSMVFALMEQAYAKFRDSQGGRDSDDSKKGLRKIGSGGSAARVMEALTGKPAQTFQIRTFTPTQASRIFVLVQSANTGHLVGAGTSFDGKEWQTRLAAAAKAGFIDAKLAQSATMDGRGLVEAHAYSIFSARKDKSGARYVRLRNPWGSKVPKGATVSGFRNGEFELKLEEFMTYYDTVYVGAAIGNKKR
jgi:hypothetical protein